ncbi:MAG: hypothetical protein IJ220_07540 [Clostridia bacterium]|nr:hypothetical protein [Clostridia bacterium]
MFLAEHGIQPIIIEQGKMVDDRIADVKEFKKEGKLNVFSNIQFGEGGAGTFSDGKLNTGINSPYCKKVLETFVKFGAPEQILYMNKPHVGTDNLVKVVRNMREEIIRLGGTFYFNEKVTDFEFENSQLKAVVCSSNVDEKCVVAHTHEAIHPLACHNHSVRSNLRNKEENVAVNSVRHKIVTDTAILAIGHSSRDTFEKLFELGLNMEAKSFSVGARIEHKQEMINKAQYGEETQLKLPSADYKLVYHGEDRTLYTFCMCPGGVVVPSTSEENAVVTNGMSYFARNMENANSAILVGVNPEDFEGNHPLRGMYFQRELEHKAFEIGGSDYKAPAQRVEDFLAKRKTTNWGEVKPSYLPGVTMADLHEVLPKFVTDTIEEGIINLDKKLKGFANKDAILTGVETRSSSPVRILRNEDGMANIQGIYPCGEGPGYAGGIMSAAVDGIKVAIKILEKEV